MLTEKQIAQLKQHPELGWISALKAGAIPQLVEARTLQLFPVLILVGGGAQTQARGTIASHRKELEAIRRQLERRKKKILHKEEIALKVGRVVSRFTMAKHFALTIEDGRFQAQRRAGSGSVRQTFCSRADQKTTEANGRGISGAELSHLAPSTGHALQKYLPGTSEERSALL